MTDIDISQAEADALIDMDKHKVDDKTWTFPRPGDKITVPLVSEDRREHFILDVSRSQIVLSKATYQNRAHKAVILMRLDLGGSPHRNPNGEEVSCPHLHVYREGYADKWAVPAPAEIFSQPDRLLATLTAFMQHCNIVQPPTIQWSLL